MRRELVTRDELQNRLREHGVDDPRDVKLACMEPDGQISVIKRSPAQSDDSASGNRKRGPRT